MKNITKAIFTVFLSVSIIFSSTALTAFASTVNVVTSTYNRVDEIKDWGAATTKVIVDIQKSISPILISNDTFSVYVERVDKREEKNPIEKGDRVVTKAYVSNETGVEVQNGKGHYVTLELQVGPKVSLASPLNYSGPGNAWIDCNYTITQKKTISSSDGTVSDIVANKMKNRYTPDLEKFKFSAYTHKDGIKLSYASFAPEASGAKKPLIVWLHGGGEGGTDATIPLSANKAVAFASKPIQDIFGGAYVYVPQTPTRWMDDGKVIVSGKEKANAVSKYTGALQGAIEDYVSKNPGIDKNRIYIGGASNGGFMVIRLLADYPKYYAAAFPVCEGIKEEFLSNAAINEMKNIPMWFVASAADNVLPAPMFTVKLYDRLVKAGAPEIYFNYYKNVVDVTGQYKKENGTPYEYDGHWSWIYVYNNSPTQKIDGKEVSIMEWLAAQKLK